MAFYRHRLIQKIYGGNMKWIDIGFHFTQKDPDDFIKDMRDGRSNFVADYGLTISHEISEDDYNNRKEYTIPINQIVYQFNMFL